MSILKEFQLIPGNSLEKEKAVIFLNETNCIADLYTRCLGNIKTEDCSKIVIECVDSINNNFIIKTDRIYDIQVICNFESFFNSTEIEKKKITLNLIMDALEKLLKQNDWNKDIFYKAAQKVKELNYINEWTWKKSLKVSPSKQYSVEVFCEHNLDEFIINCIFRKKSDGNFIKVRVVDGITPHWICYLYNLGEIKWISSHKVILINKIGTEQWIIYLIEKKIVYRKHINLSKNIFVDRVVNKFSWFD